MTCWLCGTPVPDPPHTVLVVGGFEVARACPRHGEAVRFALKGAVAFRHFARVWIERQAALKVAAAKAAAAKAAGGAVPPAAANGGR